MKTLLQINVTANWGSTGKIAEQIGLCAQNHGWNSYIAYGRKMNPTQSQLIKVGNRLDVYMHYAINRFFDMEGYGSRRATRKLLKVIDQIHPDVIHLHNIHDHWLNYPLLFKSLAESKIPVVWTQHDCWGFTGHCGFMHSDCDKWKTRCGNCAYKFKFCLDRSQKNFDLKKELFTKPNITIAPVSEWLGGLVKESFLKDLPMKVIPNGVDVNTFKPIDFDVKAKYGIEGKFMVMGAATMWDSRKNVEDYFRLRAILGSEYAIVMVGLSPDQVNTLPEGIIGLEKTKSVADLVALYSSADVLLSLSKAETFGLTMAEAMACGTPVIAYNNTAHPEVVKDGCGYIVEDGNVEAVKERLEIIRKNGKASYSQKCISVAREFYDKDKNFNEYISLYINLLGGGGSARSCNGVVRE